MKKSLKFIICVCALCAVASVSILAGCGGDNGGSTAEKVSLNFDTAGGSAITAVQIDKNAEYELPTPTRDGYVFKGWYVNQALTGSPVTKVTVADDTTFYAKWSKLYSIILELDGGNLSQTTVKAEEGANVYEAVAGLIPTKGDFRFGAWFEGSRELSQSKKMPASDVTLTAKYKVQFTVEHYTEKLEGEGYEKVLEDTVSYDYIGKKIESEPIIAGFKEVINDNSVFSLTLSANKEENVFRHYYDRKQITVTFNSNYPSSVKDTEKVFNVKYGTEIEIPSDYFFDGYCLAGWSTSRDGEVEYEANSIAERLYNATETWTPVEFTPDSDITLFATWRQGYTDMFAGHDYLFLLDENSEVIYLSRGGRFFQGEYNAKNKEFTFVNYANKPNGETLLTGRLNSNGTFVYYDKDKASYTSTLYRIGVGLVETDSIQFGKADEITYYVDGEAPSKGTYVLLAEEEIYKATFTEGPKAGQTMYFLLGYVSAPNGGMQNAFNVRNDDEVNLGSLPQIALYQGQLNGFYPLVSFDGFGTATMTRRTSTGGEEKSNYSYIFGEDGETVTLLDSNGRNAGTLKIVTEESLKDATGNPIKGYTIYNNLLDQKLLVEQGGSLTLDGMYRGIYEKDGVVVSGFYSSANSAFGGTLVTLIDAENNKEYKFIITATSSWVEPEDGGSPVQEINYTTVIKNDNYVEFNYIKDDDKIYYAPLLVFGETNDASFVSVYGYDSATQKYAKVLDGTVAYDETTKLYTFTTKVAYPEAVYVEEPMKLINVKAFVFATDTQSYSYDVTYWYYYETDEGKVELAKTYKDGNNELTIVSQYAILNENGLIVTYSYKIQDEYYVLTSTFETRYVSVDKENMTFTILTELPYKIYSINHKRVVDKNVYFYFTGKTNEMVYYKNGQSLPGTYASQGQNAFLQEVYKYTVTATGEEIEFIIYKASGDSVFCVYDENYANTYTVKDGNGRFVLDGYGYMGIYYDENGTASYTVYTATYSGNNVKTFTVMLSGKYRYFDVTGTTFTVRGAEYGNYDVVDNKANTGWKINLDGYGKFTLTKTGETTIVGNYTVDGDSYEISGYVVDGKTINWVAKIKSGEFVIARADVVREYIHTGDWSLLVLDALGNAEVYSVRGNKQEGMYILIDDGLLYYQNDKGTNAGTFIFDKDTGVITPVSLTGKSYYSSDLKALQFTKTGLLIENNATKVQFYNVASDGTVTIYSTPDENNTLPVNEFGFIESNFGKFPSEVELNGVHYYANSIFGGITFTRSSTDYKLPYGVDADGNELFADIKDIGFTPTGEDEFAVNAYVTIAAPNGDGTFSDRTITCQMQRVVDADTNEATTTLIIPLNNGGYYSFDIDLTFAGEENSTYVINSQTFKIEYVSYDYLDIYYQVYMMVGPIQLKNTFGLITITQAFNPDGSAGEVRAMGTDFGDSAKAKGLVDFNGNPINFENAPIYSSGKTTIIVMNSDDGYEYVIAFNQKNHQAFSGVAAFEVVMFYRNETFECGDYTVTVSRAIYASEEKYIGTDIGVTIEKNGVNVKGENDLEYVYVVGDDVYYVVRTYDGNTLTATKYYKLSFTEDNGLDVEDTKLYPYLDATVTEVEVKTYFAANGDFVDYLPATDEIVVIKLDKEYAVLSCEKETDGSYTVTIGTDIVYTVVIDGEKATITRKK